MTVWDERYVDEKNGLERKSSFNYFQRLLKQKTYPRTITNLHKEIIQETIQLNHNNCPTPCNRICHVDYDDKCPDDFKPKKPIKIDTLYDYSRKWKYFKRLDAYDKYLMDLHLKTKEHDVMEWESEQLAMARQRSNFHNDTLQKLHNAPEVDQTQADGTVIKGIPVDKKVDSESENQRAYDKSIDSVYKILYGGVTKRENHNHNDNSGELNINNKFKVKSLEEEEKEADEYFKELEKELQ